MRSTIHHARQQAVLLDRSLAARGREQKHATFTRMPRNVNAGYMELALLKPKYEYIQFVKMPADYVEFRCKYGVVACT